MKKEKSFSVLSKVNYMLIIAGLILITIGFIFMAGGGTKDPNVFAGETLFDFRRLTLSTIFLILGFALEVFAILYRPKNQKDSE